MPGGVVRELGPSTACWLSRDAAATDVDDMHEHDSAAPRTGGSGGILAPRIRVICRTCGYLRLETTAVSARACIDDGTATYSFRCPACGLLEVQAMDPALVPVLRDAGVPVTEWWLPAELGERTDRAPLDAWEVDVLSAALAGDDWLDAFLHDA